MDSSRSTIRRASPSVRPSTQSIPVAPKWRVESILKGPLLNIDEVLHWLPDGLLEDNSADLAKSLRRLYPGQEYTVKLLGVAQPANSWDFKYHGTSWLGAFAILLEGFLPGYKGAQGKHCLLYTSPSPRD